MKSCAYLVVGGGLAGAEAAKAIRGIDNDGEILIVGKEPHRPYNRPPLSKAFMRGEKQEEAIYVDTEKEYKKRNIELMVGRAATRIDRKDNIVLLKDGEEIRYGKLLLATGGTPMVPDITGMDLAGVYTLRTIDDAKAIRSEAKEGRQAVLIGGGFIGVEAAASLRHHGTEVTVLERANAIFREIAEADSARFIREQCEKNGVRFVVNADVMAIEGHKHVEAVITRDGTRYPCDFVVVAVGIRPDIALARDAGLTLEEKGVRVDAHLRTSDPDIYAAGDIANYPDPWFDARRRVEHWGQAEYTGQLAGKNMAGQSTSYDLVTYVWSDIFDIHLEFGGWARAADTTRLRGKPEDGSFLVLYLKQNVLKAYLAVNAPKEEYGPLEKLIKERVDLSDRLDELTNRKTDVQKAVAAMA